MILDRCTTLSFSAFLLLAACSYLPETGPDSQDVLIRETRDYIELRPASTLDGRTGFIFYPGGLVDPHAYIDLASQFAISGSGHHVVIAKMPANLAVLGAKAGMKILEEFPDKRWVIGGHSLGGVMACSMLARNSEGFDGLVLMASYASGSVDLSDWKGAVLSISASNDGVLDWEKYEEAKARLPGHSVYFNIAGGNHAGFGSYGTQKGDGEAEISLENQHQQIIEQIQNFYLENEFE